MRVAGAVRAAAGPLSRTELYRLAIELAVTDALASTIWRWLHEDAIKPWQQQCWIYRRDPEFAEQAGRAICTAERSTAAPALNCPL